MHPAPRGALNPSLLLLPAFAACTDDYGVMAIITFEETP